MIRRAAMVRRYPTWADRKGWQFIVTPLTRLYHQVLGTDWIDLFLIPSMGDYHTLDESINFSREQATQRDRCSGQEVGEAPIFRLCDPPNRAQIIQAAAEPGIINAAMVPYTPLAREGIFSEQGPGLLLGEGDQPHLDEAGRRQALR